MSFTSLLPGTFNSGTSFSFRLDTNGGANRFGFDGDNFFATGQGVGGRVRFDDLDPFFDRAVTLFGGTLVQDAEFLDADIAAGQVPTDLRVEDGTLAVIEGPGVSGSYQVRFGSSDHAQTFLDFVQQMLSEVNLNSAIAADPTEFRFAAGDLELFYDAASRDFGFVAADGTEQRFETLEPFVEALAQELGGTQTRDGRFNDQRISDGSIPNIIDVRGLDDLVIGGRSVGGQFKFAFATPEEATFAEELFKHLFVQIAETGALAADIAPVAVDDMAMTDEDTPAVITVLANDTDPDSTLSLVAIDGVSVVAGDSVGLASGASVTLNANGTLTYDPTGLFEDVAAGEDFIDSFTYDIAGDGQTATATVSVTVADVPDNQAPAITTTELSSRENDPIVGFVLATDLDGDTLTWSITGGADADAFVQTGTRLTENGLLEFAAAQDFEAPGDANGDNIFEVEVSVSDGFESTSQLVNVSLGNLLEFNAVFSPEQRDFTISELAEIGTVVVDFDYIDPDFGPDEADLFLDSSGSFPFTFDPATGRLTTTGPLDFESQSSYDAFLELPIEAEVTPTSVVDFGEKTVLQTGTVEERTALSDVFVPFTITVFDVEETPTIMTLDLVAPETQAIAGFVLVETEVGTPTWSITGGADADAFVQTGTRLTENGLLEFVTARDFEAPEDANGDNVYEVEVTVDNGLEAVSQLIEVTVSDIAEINSFFSPDISELTISETTPVGTEIGRIEIIDPDASVTAPGIDFLFANGPGFNVDATGRITVNAPLDASAFPSVDLALLANGDEVGFSITRTPNFDQKTVSDVATDDLARLQTSVTVNVTENQAPTITTTALSSPETQTLAGFVLAEDAPLDALTWSITGGADAAAFIQDGTRLTENGLLEFVSAPDFENPADANGDNVFEVEVTVSDGFDSTSQLVEVSVTGILEVNGSVTPQPTSFTVSEFAPVGTVVADLDFIDPDFGPDDLGEFTLFFGGGAPFELSPDGVIRTTALLDFETRSQFSFSVQRPAEEGLLLFTTADFDTKTIEETAGISIVSTPIEVQIDIEDGEETPAITTTALTNPETQAIAGFVLVDSPAGTPTWSITGGADADAFIQTGTRLTENGLLEFVSARDFEAPEDANGDNVYEVEVTVDNSFDSAVQLIEVTVSDIAEINSFFSPDISDLTVVETTPVGTEIGRIEIIDPDASVTAPTINFIFANGPGFNVDPTGRITVNAPLDASAFPSVDLALLANGDEVGFSITRTPDFDQKTVSDGATEQFARLQTSVTVNVTESAPPVAVNDLNLVVGDKQVLAGAVIGNVLSNDSDPDNDILQVETFGEADFRIRTDAGDLVIQPNGDVTLDSNGNSLPLSGASLLLTSNVGYFATDGKNLSNEGSVSVRIENEPDPALFGGDLTGTVTEDDRGGPNLLVATGQATIDDPDSGAVNTLFDTNEFRAQTLTGTFGTLQIAADGVWTYTADNSQSAIQDLEDGESLVDSFTVQQIQGLAGFQGQPLGGDSTNIDITINGVDEPPIVDTFGVFLLGVGRNDNLGTSVASIGDVNGDGIEDVAISGGRGRGPVYVVFGEDTAGGANARSGVDLAALDGSDGFAVTGLRGAGPFGPAIAPAGDLNGDGIDDLLVGAGDTRQGFDRAAFVIFGQSAGTPFAAEVDVTALNGTDGVTFQGAATPELGQDWLASAGDGNGDGIDDIVVGTAAGATIIYGRDSNDPAFGATVDLTALTDAQVATILGALTVKSAGDLNGDGLPDLVFTTATGGGVVFGTGQDLAGPIDPASLTGTTGFLFTGNGVPLVEIGVGGDLNGDGVADILLTASSPNPPNGVSSATSYAVFGRADGIFGANVDLAALDGTDGFSITLSADPFSPNFEEIDIVGDVNGDGVDDFILGAPNRDLPGSPGTAYLIFGRDTETAGDFAAALDLSTLDPSQGYVISGIFNGLSQFAGPTANPDIFPDFAGLGVSAAGDVNNDGFADLLVGAPLADRNSVRTGDLGGDDEGAGYIVYGGPDALAAYDAFDGTVDGQLRLASLGFKPDEQFGTRLEIADSFFEDNTFSELRFSLGYVVGSAGDINNDGINDIVVGAPKRDTVGNAIGTTLEGSVFVVFGQENGLPPLIDLETMTEDQGFELVGDTDEGAAGLRVDGLGDINGDGIDDLGVTTFNFPGENDFIVYGRDTAANDHFERIIVLEDLSPDEALRVEIVQRSGIFAEIGAAGDVNNDGIADFTAQEKVIFGRADCFGATLVPDDLSGGIGFELEGLNLSSVGIGDVNGDGIDDIAFVEGVFVSDPVRPIDRFAIPTNKVHVVFGREDGFDELIARASLDGTNGFVVASPSLGLGFSIDTAGDVNNDGVTDIVIGDPRAASEPNAFHVIYGKDSTQQGVTFAAEIALDGLAVADGFTITDAENPGSQLGSSAAGVGDVDGDGIDDFLVGAPEDSPNGFRSGTVYLVFGKDGSAGESFGDGGGLSSLNATDVLVFNGVKTGDDAGFAVDWLGDVNGDGIADFAIQAGRPDTIDDNLIEGPRAGETYIIYGGAENLSRLDAADGLIDGSIDLRLIDDPTEPFAFV